MATLRNGTSGADLFSNAPLAEPGAINFDNGDLIDGRGGDDTYRLHFAAGVAVTVRISESADAGFDRVIFDYATAPAGTHQTYTLPAEVEAGSVGTNPVDPLYTIAGNALGNWIAAGGGQADARNAAMGAGGDDLLLAGPGWTRLDGGDGNDLFDILLSADPATTVNAQALGGLGRDMLMIRADAPVAGILLNLALQGISLSLGPAQALPGGAVALSRVELAWVATPAADSLAGSGADTLIGGIGDNLLVAGGGNDRLDGGGGNDTLYGDTPGDIGLLPSAWVDSMHGPSAYGFERMPGSDTLIGGDGNDLCAGGGGGDSLVGGIGGDTLLGWLPPPDPARPDGWMTAEAVAAAVAQHQPDGVDWLRGQEGNDLLVGGEGRDRLFGGDGNDTLIGGPLRDLLRGEAGADVVRMLAMGDAADRIVAFTPGVDRLEISAAGFGGGLVQGEDVDGRFLLGSLPRGWVGGAFLYDAPTGLLHWDANGSAAGQRMLVAVIDPGTALTATDIVIIA